MLRASQVFQKRFKSLSRRDPPETFRNLLVSGPESTSSVTKLTVEGPCAGQHGVELHPHAIRQHALNNTGADVSLSHRGGTVGMRLLGPTTPLETVARPLP